jgi:hypothetical protein
MDKCDDPNWLPNLSDADRLKAQAALNRLRKALSPEAKGRHKHAYAKALELVKSGVLDLRQFSQAFLEALGPYPPQNVKFYFMQAKQEIGHIQRSEEELIEMLTSDDEQLDGHGG